MNARKPTLYKRSVDYRNGDEEQHCGNCVMFHPDRRPSLNGTCDLVIGVIMAHMVCDKWEAKPGE